MLCLAAVASAQLLNPISQDRKLSGQAIAQTGSEVVDTGLIELSPPAGDFGMWGSSAEGIQPTQATLSTMASATTGLNYYQGGWNGDNVITITQSTGNVSCGGPAPVFSAHPMASQKFVMTFTTSALLDYTLDYSIGGSAIDTGLSIKLTKQGDPTPLFEKVTPYVDEGGVTQWFVGGTGVTGTIAPGTYTIECHGKVEFMWQLPEVRGRRRLRRRLRWDLHIHRDREHHRSPRRHELRRRGRFQGHQSVRSDSVRRYAVQIR